MNKKILEKLALQGPIYQEKRRSRFWQEGVFPKRISDRKMMRQKIEYIHQNPVRKGFVETPEIWTYSSARNYFGMAGELEVCTDW